MKTLLLLGAALLLGARAQAALAHSTVEFLQKLNISANSADVVAVADDSVNGVTLDSLAADGDRTGAKRFIATRAFIHKYLKDPSTAFPSTELYDVAYLTKTEKDFVFQQITGSFGVSAA
jgi:hypothetical protein